MSHRESSRWSWRSWALVLLGCAAACGACRSRESAEVEMEIRSVGMDNASRAPVVVLQDKAKRVALPIWIGPAEAQAIAMQLEGVEPPRPMTHDLMKAVLDHAGIDFQRVLIGDLKDRTYYARIFLRSGRKDIELDSRPSDAIALAVRFHKPIFVARTLLQNEIAIDLRRQATADGVFTFAGITVQDLTAELADYFSLPAGRGVLVADVSVGARAAVQRGDIIVAVDGDGISNLSALQAKLDAIAGGGHADLAVQRAGEQIHLDLALE